MGLYPMSVTPSNRLQRRQKLRVGFLLVEKFTLNAFSGFIDALRLASEEGARSRQILCGWEIMGAGPVKASCGLHVVPTTELVEPSSYDYIAVCGGNGYLDRTHPKWLDRYLKRADAAGVPLVGVCGGTFNIAWAGLMDGYPACVHWNIFEAFREEFPGIDARPDRIFLDAGARITCAGSAGATDLALHLIARHCGPERAQQSMRHMMLPGARPADFPQAHFYSDLSGVRDTGVRRAVQLMEQTLNSPAPMSRIAEVAGMSLRQLERRFSAELGTTPAGYCRDLRLKYGAWLLQHTTNTIADVASTCGFADSAHFNRNFRSRFQQTPGAYRRIKVGGHETRALAESARPALVS